MEKAELKQTLDEWRETYLLLSSSLLERTTVNLPSFEIALALLGVRRAGKTFSAFEASRLVAPERVLYYNFEDPLFLGVPGPAPLDLLLATAQEYRSEQIELLILDEIHNVPGWERWCRKIIDQQRYRLIVTGSSASLLSSELATSLTGRCLEHTVWPLSFHERLNFLGAHSTDRLHLLPQVRKYMEWGGFPLVTKTENERERTTILKQYLTDILYRDVMQRHQIRDARALNQIVHYLLSNLSSLHSYTSIAKAFQVSPDLAEHCVTALKDAFLVFEVERYHHNLKVQARDPRKVYIVDAGLRRVAARSAEDDTGKILENLVYLELRRRGHTPMYFRDKHEVDFLILEHYQPVEAIQVCAEGMNSPKTRERELTALSECLISCELEEGVIVTLDHEENIKLPGGSWARAVPAYRWLLGLKCS